MKKMIPVLIAVLLLAACSNTTITPAQDIATGSPVDSTTSDSVASDSSASDTSGASVTEAAVKDTLKPIAESTVEPTTEETSQEMTGEDAEYSTYTQSKEAAVDYLASRLYNGAYTVFVYQDFSAAANHFTQKAKIDDGNSEYVFDMNENWQVDPYSGDSAIECRVKTQGNSWGGWLFLNGYLPDGETVPQLSFGEVNGAGMDLTGATKLSFMAKGAQGGEVVEFFTAGLGYDGETNHQIAEFPDSSRKRSLGFVTLTDEWTEYNLDVSDADLSNIGCGFGFVLSGTQSGNTETVFYLDDIRFDGPIAYLQKPPRLIKSYETDTRVNTDHLYIENAAFSYDNALAAMALLSEGRQEEARLILDAFAYAVENDRYQADRIRNAYVYGNLTPFPGWADGARLPGWYDAEDGQYYEDQYQVGTNVGNSSFVAMALLQYYRLYGGEEYLALAETIMTWVLDNCADSTPGFMAGYDGWPEGDGSAIFTYTYKSTEHNIDAYAVFKQLYALTGNERYRYAYESAWVFLLSMYDQEKGYFYTGTGDDGVTPSKENIVLDAQVWSLLSMSEDESTPYQPSLSTAVAMKTIEGGYPFHAENTNGGWWPEGTAFTSLTLREYGLHDEAQSALDAMMDIQQSNGAFPAASDEKLTTGFDLFTGEPWTYGNIPHIAPAAWYVMAVNGFNPFKF